MQRHILKKRPSSRIQIYAIWFSMFPGDSRSKWKGKLLTDLRVTHMWDEEKIVGRWFTEYLRQPEDYKTEVTWDAYFLYPLETHWNLTLPPPLSWGSPIILKSRELGRVLLPLLD